MSNAREEKPVTIDQIYEHMEKEGKITTPVTIKDFLLTAGIGVPLWFGFTLPLAVITSATKAILPKSSPPEIKSSEMNDNKEEEEDVFPSIADIVPMKDRKYDLVLFGATGFVGKLALEYMVKTYGVNKDIKWAIAGRTKSKLEASKALVAELIGDDSVLKVDTLIADTSCRSTLHNVVKDTKVVATSVGPFQIYGGPLVEFCSKYGTDYVDITAETDWHKDMIMSWDDTARKTGAKMVSFCGNDSIPWDLTVHKMSKILKEECEDDLLEVQCFDDYNGGGPSGGTMASALYSIDGAGLGQQYEFNPLMRKADGTKSKFTVVGENVGLPGKIKGNDVFSKNYEGPFVMTAVNTEVLKRSHALRSEGNAKIKYRESLLAKDWMTAFTSWFTLVSGITVLFTPIRSLVVPKPGEGSPRQVLEKGHLSVAGFGLGSKGNKVKTLFYFPKDTGYMDTARMLVESGLCLALDKKKLHVDKGGFYTPSICMGDALMDRLCNTGCLFAAEAIKLQSKL